MTNTGKIFRSSTYFLCLLFFACQDGQKGSDETPTSGNIKIEADESFKLLLDTETFTFQSLYRNAKITTSFKAESDVIADFMNDSVRLIVVSRKLTESETQHLTERRIIPRTTKIAHDAVALIVHKDNPDSLLRYDQLQSIFTGKITKWHDIDPKSKLTDLIVVFDNTKSGNLRFIKEKFIGSKPVPSYCFAVNSNTEVLDYVKKKNNAIGIIGVNWISDRHDTISHKFLRDVRVIAVGEQGDNKGTGEFHKPYQGYIAEGSYPLCREVYVICRETFSGLGTGFASFIAGDVGQRIILKSGLVPATMPVRLVQIKK